MREAEAANVIAAGETLTASRQRMAALFAISATALTFVLLWPTTASLMQRWEDTVHRTYTHGYVIVALSLWLLWRDRSRFGSVQASYLALAGLLAGGFIWLVAVRAGLQIVHQALLPAMALCAVIAACGWGALRASLFPAAYLYCAIPLWDAINPLLQSISVFAVRILLRIAGIPAFFEGNTFQLPAGSFEIADGCSGLHFFVVALSISLLYGAVNRDPVTTRLKLVGFALALAMATNWIRVFIIVLAGHLTDMQHYLVSGEHYSFGWFMFAGAMLIFFLVVRRWPLVEHPRLQIAERPPRATAPWGPYVMTIAALAAAPLWNLLDTNLAEAADGHDLPQTVDGWSMSARPIEWRPIFKGADREQFAEYSSSGGVIQAYAATYLQQRQNKEIAGYENSVLGENATSLRGAGSAPKWMDVRGRDEMGEEWLVRYTHRIDDGWFGSALAAQLTYGLRSLSGAPLSSLVAVRSRCSADCEEARRLLDEFTGAAFRP